MSVARVTIYGRLFGQQTQNVVHFDHTDYVSSDLPVLVTNVRDFWCDNPFRLNVDGSFIYEKIHAVIIDNPADRIDLPLSMQGIGGPSTNGLPFVSAVFQLKSEFPGRAGRGRFFQAGFGQGFYNAGLWNSQAMVNLTACAEALQGFWCGPNGSRVQATGWSLVLNKRGHVADPHPVVDVIAREMVGYIGKRQLGRGA